jgi:hypothetical protein
MRIRIVLCLALLAGLVFLLLRNSGGLSDPASGPPAQPAVSVAQGPSEPAPHDEAAHQHDQHEAVPQHAEVAKARAAGTASLSQEELWAQTVTEPAFAAFKEWTERYGNAGQAARTALEAEGAVLARARLAALTDLIQSNPERAVQLAVPESLRGRWPEAVRALLETRVDATGDYEVVCVTPAPGQKVAAPFIRSASINGVRHRVFAYGRALDYVTRKDMPLRGIAVPWSAASRAPADPIGLRPIRLMALGAPVDGSDAGFDLPQAAGSPPTAESPYTEGRKRYLLMRVDFPDYAVDVFPTNTAFQHMIDMSNFLAAISYNKHIIAPVGKGSDITPVMRMSQNASAYDNGGLSVLYPEARTTAQNVFGYNLSQYDFFFVCTGGRPSYGYAGLGYVGSVGYHLANGYFDVRTSAHELGHNLGLSHANWLDTGDRSTIGAGSNEEYGDPFDTMGGSGGGSRHFSASFKSRLDWIPANDAITVTTSGIYRLHAHDITTAPFGLRAIRLNRPSGDPYWIEFRQLWTANKALMNGVNFRRAAGASQLLDMTPGSSGGKDDHSLTIGRTFSEPALNFHVTALRKGNTHPESIDLAIHFGPFPGNQPPSAIARASTINAAVGQAITFTATAADPNGDALAYAWDFGDGDYSVDNAAATTHSFSAVGEYYVEVTVSDMKGGVARDSVLVNVGAPTTFSISGRVLNHNGQPLSGIRVSVSESRYAFSESDGAYTISRLTAGNYTVTAIEPVTDALMFANPFFNNPVTVGPDFTTADFMVSTNPPPIVTALIAANSAWRYLDNGTDQGVAWRAPAFNDAAWASGVGVLGYTDGNDQIDTIISFGPNSANKYITYYFRRPFNSPAPAAFTGLRLRVRRDDGVVVYLNGSEVYRDNMPAGAPAYLTTASGTVEPNTYLQQDLPLTGLLAGNNVIAAEVHQAGATSSDAAFDLALDGISATNAAAFIVVYLSSPAAQQVFTNPPSIPLSAFARSTAATASQVDFYADGVKVGEDSTAPFSFAWPSPAAGAHTLQAVGVFPGRSVTSAPVQVTVVGTPTLAVQLTGPADGAGFIVPASVPLAATVTPGAAPVSRVQFFANGGLVSEDISAPYSATLSTDMPTAQRLIAVAIDGAGNAATSAPVNVTFLPPASPTRLISFGEVWKYLDDGTDQGAAWRAPGFDDRLWAAGPARLGYGGDGEVTGISAGPNPNLRAITTYFRKSFNVADPAAFSGLLLRLVRDDGVIVHLNGVELFRDNLLSGPVAWNALASAPISGAAETTPLEIQLSPASLVAGVNVLAVEIHQVTILDGDLGYDLSLAGLRAPDSATPVYLTEPAQGARFNGPTNILLASYAWIDGLGLPATVAYYADGSLLGIAAASAPFRFAWNNAPIGAHELVAIASWSGGVSATSAPVNLVVASPPPRIQPVAANVIPAGAAWRYWDNVALVADGWQTREFVDTAWPNGLARFGWGLDGEVTTLTGSRVTHYFRRTFTVPNPASYTELVFQLARDDGAVVYLNGVELFRNNMPDGPVGPNTLAATTLNTPDETAYVPHVVQTAGSGITTGANVVAVELHQSSAASSDGGFDLQLSAYGTTEPRVYLTTPKDGASYSGSPVIHLEALARGVGTAVVTNVEFFANGARLGHATASPWRLAWSNAPLGFIFLTARSTDATGASADSVPILISVGRERITTTLISSNSVWRYLDTGANLGTVWLNPAFNDAAWRSGPARLGFGGDGEITTVNGGPAGARFPTTYFRKSFVVPPGAIYTNLLFKLVRDDGAVVHLNGQEIFRSNMPLGPVSFSTLANNADDEQTFFPTSVAITGLPVGTNVLAVEVHQSSATSGDLGFNLELIATGYEDDSAPPLLAVTLADGLVELRWPATAIGWRVYGAALVNTPGNAWSPVVGVPLQVAGENVLTVPPVGAQRFFRLGRP